MFQLSCTGSEHSGINAGGEQLQGQAAGEADSNQPVPSEELTPGDIARNVSSVIDEEEEWDIVSFTDPRDSSVYDIVDHRVIIAFKDPPELPEVAADYFEYELASNDDYYTEVTYSAPSLDEDIADFIEDEELDVYAEWPEVGGLAAVLPAGQTVSDAVANWPTEYSDIIYRVDADRMIDGDSLSSVPPDDYLYDLENDPGAPHDDLISWHVNPDANGEHINVYDVWDYYAGSYAMVNTAIAILDTGVQYSHDLDSTRKCNSIWS